MVRFLKPKRMWPRLSTHMSSMIKHAFNIPSHHKSGAIVGIAAIFNHEWTRMKPQKGYEKVGDVGHIAPMFPQKVLGNLEHQA